MTKPTDPPKEDAAKKPDEELDEAQLERVSGGTDDAPGFLKIDLVAQKQTIKL